MTKGHLIFSGILALSTALAAGGASAQERIVRQHRVVHVAAVREPPPVTIQKRSFLDPGNVVPVGSDSEALAANTYEHQPIYRSFDTAFFGESELPGPYDLPNNPRFFPRQNLDLPF